MEINIRYFAALRDRMGKAEDSLETSMSNPTGSDIVDMLKQRDDAAEALDHPSVRIIVNDEIAPKSTVLSHGDVVAFCPPFSGG